MHIFSKVLARLLFGVVGICVASQSWAVLIVGGPFDGTDVGIVDTYIAETGVLSGQAAEEQWVEDNSPLTDVSLGTKTDDVPWYNTDTANVIAVDFPHVAQALREKIYTFPSPLRTPLYAPLIALAAIAVVVIFSTSGRTRNLPAESSELTRLKLQDPALGARVSKILTGHAVESKKDTLNLSHVLGQLNYPAISTGLRILATQLPE